MKLAEHPPFELFSRELYELCQKHGFCGFSVVADKTGAGVCFRMDGQLTPLRHSEMQGGLNGCHIDPKLKEREPDPERRLILCERSKRFLYAMAGQSATIITELLAMAVVLADYEQKVLQQELSEQKSNPNQP